MINKHNYEIWLMDYLDGKLGAAEVRELMGFLEQNPEVKVAMENLDQVILEKEETISAFDKSSLKKPLFSETKHNHNALLVGAVENTLSRQQEEKLKHAMAAYPELINELLLFEKTRIKPDLSIVYPNKKKLKKSRPLFTSYSSWLKAAAALLMISSIGWFLIKPDDTKLQNRVSESRPQKTLESQEIEQRANKKISLNTQNQKEKTNRVNGQKFVAHAHKKNRPNFNNGVLIQSTSKQITQHTPVIIITPKMALISKSVNVLKPLNIPNQINQIAYRQRQEKKEEFVALPDLIYAGVKAQKGKVLVENITSTKLKTEDAGWLALAFINKITQANIRVVRTFNAKGKTKGIDISANGFEFKMGKKTANPL